MISFDAFAFDCLVGKFVFDVFSGNENCAAKRLNRLYGLTPFSTRVSGLMSKSQMFWLAEMTQSPESVLRIFNQLSKNSQTNSAAMISCTSVNIFLPRLLMF
jgi:hypothetical protein